MSRQGISKMSKEMDLWGLQGALRKIAGTGVVKRPDREKSSQDFPVLDHTVLRAS